MLGQKSKDAARSQQITGQRVHIQYLRWASSRPCITQLNHQAHESSRRARSAMISAVSYGRWRGPGREVNAARAQAGSGLMLGRMPVGVTMNGTGQNLNNSELAGRVGEAWKLWRISSRHGRLAC